MTRYMEDNLDMPLQKVLSVMQRRILTQSTYFGIRTSRNPLDHWVYQEIIFRHRPRVIIEIGNYKGASTLAMAHLCDLIGRGRVIGLDESHEIVSEAVKRHPRITLIEGDACQSFPQVRQLIAEGESVLIIEDSSHTYDNTLKVMRTYSALCQPGDWFIVEDGICHHGLSEGPNPGPYEAIETFIGERTDFSIDRSRESFLVTWNPKGYLRRTDAG